MDIDIASSERWQYFRTVGLWPKKSKLDPERWLKNFPRSETQLATRLLEGFTYFSSELISQMFKGAFCDLGQHVVRSKTDIGAATLEWSAFINKLRIVRVTGEIPNDSDSGFIFTRLARESLGIKESQIISPQQAVESCRTGLDQLIVFVDDFVGSGNQFSDTWERQVEVAGDRTSSFRDECRAWPNHRFFYCPVFCTTKGRTAINLAAPEVTIVPSHFIDQKFSALSPDSIIWRDDMATEGPCFVENASRRLGIPDLNGQEGCWRGFHKLGLAIAFEHGWPDATLPLFYTATDKCKPLVRKE